MARSTILATAVVLALVLGGEAAAAGRLAVIVHRDRDATLGVDDLAQIFLRKRRFWPGGGAIVPVNRDAMSDARAAFTRAVFGPDARRLETYWNRQYFHGVLPPATLASDEAVKRFVAGAPNAIGYVQATAVDDSVKVLLYLE